MTDQNKTAVIPFGKHRGTPIEVLQETDPKYLEWISQQQWFREKYGTIYQVIINHGNEPSETPEHNALQIKWLDLTFKRAGWLFASGDESCPLQIKATFEEDGIDVLLAGDDRHVAIELKPILGDDYPAVVRQVRGYKNIVKRRYGDSHPQLMVVFGSFQSAVASVDQLRELFKDVKFASVEDIENEKRFVPLALQISIVHDAQEEEWEIERLRKYIDEMSSVSISSLSRLDFGSSSKAVINAVAPLGPEPPFTLNGTERKEFQKHLKETVLQVLWEEIVLAHQKTVREQQKLSAIEAEASSQ